MPTGIGTLFASIQDQLLAELRSGRRVTKHPGSQGTASENGWLEVFHRHLPTRYQAHKAFVIDADGRCSQEIDIVIYDRQYTPLLYNHQSQLYVPAESVYAVFEVKQVLTKQQVTYAGRKAASVRALKRTSAPIPYAQGTYKPRRLFPILAGLLCYRSGWNPPFGARFGQALQALKPEQRLDLGCAASHGTFRVRYQRRGRPTIQTGLATQSLVQFFLWFMEHLQTLATAPAIRYAAYADSLTQE